MSQRRKFALFARVEGVSTLRMDNLDLEELRKAAEVLSALTPHAKITIEEVAVGFPNGRVTIIEGDRR